MDIESEGSNVPGQSPDEQSTSIKSHAMAILGSITLQAISSGNSLIVKNALSHSMRPTIYVLYRNIMASVVLWAWIIFKRTLPPRPSWKTWILITLLAILEPVLDQNLFYAGAKETPASFSACVSGITPAATFFLALLIGMEERDCRKRHNKLRILGAVLMIAGAGTMFYHGKPLSLSKSSKTPGAQFRRENQNWIEGPAYLVGAVFCYIFFNLLMGKVLKSYPSPIGLVVYVTSIGAVLDIAVALGVWRKEDKFWNIKPNISVAAYLYGGVFMTSLAFWLLGNLIQMRGPTFVTSFSPLTMVTVMSIGVIALGENVYLGSIIGLAIIVLGLAFFQWGEYTKTKIQD